MSETTEAARSKGYFSGFTRELIIAILTTFIVGVLVAVWPTFQAWTFPDFISGNYLLIGPEEQPGAGPDVIFAHLKSYDGRVWGSMSQGSQRWSVAGYWKNNYLIFAYRSDGNGPHSIGFGEQFFTPIKAGKDSVLMGDNRGNYCLDDTRDQKPQLLRCPNVLVEAEPETASAWANKYAAYLGTIKNQCQSVDIPIAMTVAKAEIKCPTKH